MALQPINPGQNYGFFDGLDATVASLKGGEVVGLAYVLLTNSDKAAKDQFDGYVANNSQKRPVVTSALVDSMRPLFLADEGITGYGTMWGKIVGGAIGQDNTGIVLGPSTAYGSGKITCWDGPGYYTVTTDAVDTTSTTGLVPTNTTIAGNDPLYATATGLLTPNVSVAFETIKVGRFVEFTDNRSKVATPKSMTSATNSPYGVTSTKGVFDRALIRFKVED